MTKIFFWKHMLFLNYNASCFDRNYVCLAEIILREKHTLSQFYVCRMTKYLFENTCFFTIIMHPVVTKIISALQKLFSAKNALSLNSTAPLFQWIKRYYFFMAKVFCIRKETVTADIIFLNRNFSKIFFKNWHSWSELCSYCNSINWKKLFYSFFISLVDRNYFYLMKRFLHRKKNVWW